MAVALSPSPATTVPGRETGRRAEALLRRVDLRIGRRLDGLLQGERRGRRPGPGGEQSLTRAYEPGDDVRWIDWPLSARTGEPMVRVPELEPVLTAWVLVDMSPSMAYGTAVRTKLDLAREVVAALGLVLRRRGDRLGVAATTTGALDLVRSPRGDRRGLVAAIAALDAVQVPETPGRTDLAKAIGTLGRVARHRGMVVVISDFPPSAGLERALGGLGRRHEVVAVEVRDRRESEIPRLGPVPLRDVETGRTVVVDTSDPRFQERFRSAVGAADEARAGMMARTGARLVTVRPDQDWLLPLAHALGGVRRVRVAAGVGR
ncbi:MAG: DUF58 domain-containing protein [Thermoleophilia bacterium]|nr:DUF58 domain-containing protein [Thermoleophilia bacterium]